MAMDDEDGLSFGYRLPKDVTDAVRRAFNREVASGAAGAEGGGVLGPFVYHAEGLTFAFVEHQGPGGGTCSWEGCGATIDYYLVQSKQVGVVGKRGGFCGVVEFSLYLNESAQRDLFLVTCCFVVYVLRRPSTALEYQIRGTACSMFSAIVHGDFFLSCLQRFSWFASLVFLARSTRLICKFRHAAQTPSEPSTLQEMLP